MNRPVKTGGGNIGINSQVINLDAGECWAARRGHFTRFTPWIRGGVDPTFVLSSFWKKILLPLPFVQPTACKEKQLCSAESKRFFLMFHKYNGIYSINYLRALLNTIQLCLFCNKISVECGTKKDEFTITFLSYLLLFVLLWGLFNFIIIIIIYLLSRLYWGFTFIYQKQPMFLGYVMLHQYYGYPVWYM